jgi:plastocyanin
MGPLDIEAKSFNLKFAKAGIYNYSYVVHADNHMFGTTIVEDPNVAVPTPTETFSLKVGNFTGNLDYICILHEEKRYEGNASILSRGRT